MLSVCALRRLPLAGQAVSRAALPSAARQPLTPRILATTARHVPATPSPLLAARRWLCAAPKSEPAAAEGAGAAAAPSDASQAPMVVRVGRGARTTARIVATVTFTGFALAAGYYIARELFPSSQSPNAIFNRASDVLRHNPDIVHRFGEDIKFYGEDPGGRREGRRFHIPDFKFEKDGVSHTRIRFTVEGDRVKGLAYAEVAADKKDFEYLMVQVFPQRDVITIVDQRAPEKPREVRQSDVMMALSAKRAVFYGNGPSHPMSKAQERELGDAFSYVKYVRCDRYNEECTKAGVLDVPSWQINGKIIAGFQTLEQLEAIVNKKK